MHVYSEKRAPEGWMAALRNAYDRPDPPEFLLTGGDLAFDILHKDAPAAGPQYALFQEALKLVATSPVHHTLGNHDCLGVYEDSGVSPDDPLFGKAYFLDTFGLERTYRSFDHEGWHFVLLDSIGVDREKRTYFGHVDAEQLAWLEDDLAASGKPTVISLHIPLFSNYPEWNDGTAEPDHPKATVGNCNEVAAVISRHPVKLVLAGHLHINETFSFKGTEFANIGAVSGAWWEGPRDGFQEGYARLEFSGDQVRWRYVDYGWETEEELQRQAG